ncbi:MAG: depupylase/deamidase Dop, partial [Janthinobacterium lividum]
MSVMRVMGTETEYGISVPGEPGANPMTTSSLLVNAYVGAEGGARRTRWDFEEEDPLRDARGFSMSRAVADPSQLTDEDLGMANAVLPNGARFYVDHAHPEYSSPETTGPLDAVRWDAAGDLVLAAAAQRAARLPGSPQVTLYKNNTDGKGASYGAHENYLMDRATPFPEIVRHLVPFLVSRQVVCGAGRVGLGQNGQQHGFQVSQRADFFETEVGLETTLKRPIVNTRDEPHATAEKYRRLHVIIGDANLSQTSTLLKLGTTSLVLAMVEDGVLPGGLDLATAVPSLHAISHDPSLTTTVELRDGRQMTALDLQEAYLEAARAYVADRQGDDVDVQTAQVLGLW